MTQEDNNKPYANIAALFSDPIIELVVVFGQSGAGLSTALDILEDVGFNSVDNLPLALVDQLVSLSVETEHKKLAIGVDLRTSGIDAAAMIRLADNVKQRFGARCQFVLVEASSDELIKRYQATRRRHPLLTDHNNLQEAIKTDRAFMRDIAHIADIVIDSTEMAPAGFRAKLLSQLGMTPEQTMTLTIMSFSYRKGLPDTADFIFDMRFINNPHWQPQLRAMTGCDRQVFDYVCSDESFLPFMEHVAQMLSSVLSRLDDESRPHLTFGFGCTGGKHRSVSAAKWLSAWADKNAIPYKLIHRELEIGR
ncbi:RNase adapter RapZ [Alphaproteobacteria bacterium]|nr:RNase adapter RapZ [Alphaproteobacteria bacterium]